MRRRFDGWINATHILKVAEYDKPARTRILEREVQKGTHEKVQGGYGKYQGKPGPFLHLRSLPGPLMSSTGTWIPLPDGRMLAQRNGCLDKLLPIFEFVAGDRSPPPAPKHATATSTRPKAPRAPAQPRKQPGKKLKQGFTENKLKPEAVAARNRMSEASFDAYSNQLNDDESIERATLNSISDDDMMEPGQYTGGSRKRKRGVDQAPAMSREDQQHLMWSDELLDFFMLQRSDDPPPPAPEPPLGINLNRAVDEKGNTALHWAAAMGDLNLVQDFIRRGANIDSLTHAGHTPLMHAVTFTNNYDKMSMNRLVEFLYETAGQRDCCASTVFHHIAASTMSKSKYPVARYYLECLLEKLKQTYEGRQVAMLLDLQDKQGNTAALLAAKYGARKCARILTTHGTSVDIPNHEGETAEKYIQELNERRRNRHRLGSSSPVLPPQHHDIALPFSSQPLTSSQGQARAHQYASEAATLLTSQLPTLIHSRTEALAAALEAEIADREAGAREGERVLEQRRTELAVLRKQNISLSARDEDDDYDERQLAEVASLEAESHRLILAEADGDLKQHLSAARQHERGTSDDDDDSVEVRLLLARQLRDAQHTRHRLVAEMVTAQGLAGVGGERQEAYKRLITSALGVKTDDVESMLPEMLEELEEAKGSGLLSGVSALGRAGAGAEGVGQAGVGRAAVGAGGAGAAISAMSMVVDGDGDGDGTAVAPVRMSASRAEPRVQRAANGNNGVVYAHGATGMSGPVRVMG